MEEIFIKSYAKLNLYLDIIGKREDNYHLIESMFHTVSLHDEFTIKPAQNFNISTSGKYKLYDNMEENICTKVFFHFKNNYSLENNYNIKIVKNIPTGAGLGGGSSNAATLINFLSTNIKEELTHNDILSMAEGFGADVPFFIDGGAKWVSGIGEKLTPINRLPFSALIFYPNINISTKKAYSRFNRTMFDKGRFENFKYILKTNASFNQINDALYNVFEENVFGMNHSILETKTDIESILEEKLNLTGSGSALFKLYENEESLEESYKKLKDSKNENIKNTDIIKVKLI